MNKCKECDIVAQTREIRTPDDLRDLVQIIKSALDLKILIEDLYWPSEQLRPVQPPFSTLSQEGPWPDDIEYYFACKHCKRRFHLFVDTYHGSGGKWETYQTSK
jgi:hypothetical protein